MRKLEQCAEREMLLAAVERIHPILQEHARESEEIRTLPLPVVEAMQSAGLFALAAPRDLGGFEADPLTQLEVFEAVARSEASAAWCLFIGALSSAMIGAYLGDRAATHVFGSEAFPICASQYSCKGTAERAAGGYRVRGRWTFGTGIRHSSWVVTCAQITRGGTPEVSPDGSPAQICVVVPVEQVIIEDTWHSSGLRGTGSCDFRIEDAFVPEEYVHPFPAPAPRRGGPFFRLPLLALAAPCHIGFALGAARRALDEIVSLARARQSMWSGGLISERSSFQRDLGQAQAKLAAARLLGLDAVGTMWRAALEGRSLSLDEGAELRMATAHTTDVAAEVATLAYRHGGGASLYSASPLQRYLRDIMAAAQHVGVSEEGYEYAARAALGIGSVHPTLAPRPPE